jgi:methylmalonyl-CoA/ethylmalonyl-CoA epimerase
MTTMSDLRLSKIHQVTLTVGDLDRAVGFYRETLGASFLGKWDPPGLALFDFDGVRLMVSAIPGEKEEFHGVLYFWVDDIDEAHRTLVGRGVEFEQEPHLIHRRDDGSEEWMGFFRDPDRNLLAIATEKR